MHSTQKSDLYFLIKYYLPDVNKIWYTCCVYTSIFPINRKTVSDALNYNYEDEEGGPLLPSLLGGGRSWVM